MRFEWDEDKNDINIDKHAIDFSDVSPVFESPMLISVDDRDDYGEDRWKGIGWLHGVLVVIIWTEPDEEVIRIISARKADKHERRHYEQAVSN